MENGTFSKLPSRACAEYGNLWCLFPSTGKSNATSLTLAENDNHELYYMFQIIDRP